MLAKEPFKIVFTSGVVRFDAHGTLFVNLPHTDDAPQQVRLGSVSGAPVRAPEKFARVLGAGGAGTAGGAFPASGELPRGLTVQVKEYEHAAFAQGRLEVSLAAGATIPDWWESGQDHHFVGDDPVRLWAKSSLPDGVTIEGETAPGGPPTQPKPVARAQFQPKSEKAAPPPPPPPAPEPAPAPSPGAEPAGSQPYRPGRLPAGHLGTGDKAKSGLGCSTLMLLAVLALLATSALT
jgi:hypothetical protein